MRKTIVCLFLVCIFSADFFMPKAIATTTAAAFTYVLNDDGANTVTVTGTNCTLSGNIELPEVIDGYTVTEIGAEAFLNQTEMTGFIMPDSVTAVSYSVFWSCTNMETVKLSKNLIGAMNGTFAYCRKLKAVEIPKGITSIRKTFIACKLLEEIVLPDNLTTIDINCFENCLALKRIYMPQSVSTVADNAFLYCNFSTLTAYVDNINSASAQYASSHNMKCVVTENECFSATDRCITIENNLPQVSVSLRSNKYTGAATAICAIYDSSNNNKLYDTASVPVKIELGGEKEIVFSFERIFAENLTYKIFVWDSFGCLQPVLNSVERLLKNDNINGSTQWHLNENFGSFTSWDKNMDNTGSSYPAYLEGLNNVVLNDGSEVLPSEAYRSVPRIDGEKVIVDFDFSVDRYMDDTSFRVMDGERTVLGFVTADTHLYLEQPNSTKISLIEYIPGIDSKAASYYVKAELDFNTQKIVSVRINGNVICENMDFVCQADSADGFDFLTGNEATGVMVNRRLNIYSKYVLNEDFYNANGQLPRDFDYVNEEAVSFYTINSRMPDRYSLKLDTAQDNASVIKQIEPISGKIVFEIMLLQPEKRDGIAITLKDNYTDLLSIMADGNSFICRTAAGDVSFYEYSANVWYGLKVELDLNNSKARLFVNNKLAAENIRIDNKLYMLGSIEINAAENLKPVIIDDLKLYHKKIIPEDYVPEPQISLEEKQFVTGMQMCPLWTEGQYNKAWDYIKSSPERMPILGAYDEGNPEVNDWEIKWMTEHGIDYQAICVYPNIHLTGNESYQPFKPNMVREGNALYEGFMNAKYSDKMKFCIIFENATWNLGNQHYNEFFNVYVPYWIEYYFKDERYLKIDGRPVVSIYVMDNFLKMFGSIDGTNDAAVMAGLNRFRQMCIDAGIGNPYIISHGFGYTEKTFEKYSKYGIDCLALYGWSQDTPPARQKNALDVMPGYSNTYNIDFVTCVEPRHDEITWDIRTGFKSTEEEFKDLLTWVRDDLADRIFPKSVSKKLMMYQTWNEYGEGHIMAPTTEDGFLYLNTARNVFLENSPHEDALPNTNQAERIHRLVNQERKVNFKTENDAADIPGIVKKGWYFNNSADASKWQADSQISQISNNNGKLIITASGNDPAIVCNELPNIDLFDVTYIKVRMKNNYTSSGGAVYWTTDKESGFDNKKRTHFSAPASMLGSVNDYFIPVCKNVRWNGALTGLKLNVGNIWDKSERFEIESIELLRDDSITSNAKIKINDGITVCPEEPLYKNGVLMVPLRSVAEAVGAKVGWYAHNNSYTITRDNITTVFKIGEKNGYKNNFAVDFEEAPYCASEIINDTVYVPLDLIKESLNMNITWDEGTKTLNIMTDERYVNLSGANEILKAEIFENADNLLNINQFSNITFANGSFNAKATGNDANFCMNTFAGIDTDDADSILIRVYSTAFSRVKVYFTTAADSVMNEAKSSAYIQIKPGRNVISIPADSIKNWDGNILNLLRIDPTEESGKIEIDYIALLKK